jgi:hypothetical protein
VATMMTFQVVAQRTENDDMYFTSKDREKLKVENATASANDKIDGDYNAFKKKHFDSTQEEVNQEETEAVNPTDSYSARTVNPEYISRSSSEQASEDEQNYYVEGYTPNTYDSYSSSNYNNYNNNSNNNNWNNNNWSNGNNYGYGSSPYNSWYSPYYGYCNSSMSPYYSGGSGWTLSLGYTWGNMGYGNSYYNPYSYYPSYYPNYYGYPNYYSGGYESSNANYGKRPSRHSAVVTPTPRSRERISSNTNGRTRQTVDEYYVKPFRRATTYEKPADGYSSDRYARPSSTKVRDSYNSNTRESKPTYSAPSRSSSGGSTPSRSSGSSSTPRSRGKD